MEDETSWHQQISAPNCPLQTSQPNPVLPQGLEVSSAFITKDEADRLIDIFDQNDHLWAYRGFAKRIREQRYSLPDHGDEFQWIIDRLMKSLNSSATELEDDKFEMPNELIVEEQYPTAYVRGERSGRLSSNTFETAPMKERNICPCVLEENQDQDQGQRKCSCYVAQITLLDKCIQCIDKPEERKVDCWDVESARHKFKFVMQPGTLFAKTGECLWNWRSRVVTFSTDPDDNDTSPKRVITIKFRRSYNHGKAKLGHEEEEKKEDDDQVASLLAMESKANSNKPLNELMTIIVTTSPIKSNPSTEVLERTFATFHHGGGAFFKCPKIIVCDGCRILDDDDDDADAGAKKVTKRYASAKQALRNGIATNDQAENYSEFKVALTKICKDADDDESSPFHNTRVVELEERQGYGFALRHALYHEVSTPYVCVIQHDRTFMRCTPMEEVVRSMMNKHNGDIKYVGINMRSNLTYRDIFNTKYGRTATAELIDMVIYPPELTLDSKVYGPEGSSVGDIRFEGNLKKNLDSLAKSYKDNIQMRSHAAMNRDDGKHQLSLTPTLFWYDNTHIVETAHYRDFIFNKKYRMVARGGFVEDKCSPLIVRNVERLGLKEGHAKFKCYLLDDHSGYFFTGHLDGGSFMSESERQKVSKIRSGDCVW